MARSRLDHSFSAAAVVLDVLEHLERAYQVEPVVPEFLHRDIADLTRPAAPIRALATDQDTRSGSTPRYR